MKFTDYFIERPVFASVVSLLVLLMGLYALYTLPLRQYPKTESALITVTTAYPGANAELVQGFITTPLVQSISEVDGIDYLSASSTQGVSTIQVYLKLNYDANAAMTDVMSKIQQVKYRLPSAAEDSSVDKSSTDQFALMYIGFHSKDMSSEQVTDYLTRVVQPKLETVEGVAQASILGGKTFSMRVWLDPKKMIALGVSASDLKNALTNNNVQSAAGQIKGGFVTYNVKATTDVDSVAAFKKIVIKQVSGKLVRVEDVAKVELGSESYDSLVNFSGKESVFIGLSATPSANPLDVIARIRAVLPAVEAGYPTGFTGKVVYDGTKYIQSSIHEVIETILITALIVIAVIFCFIGSMRAVFIPVITMPLSMIGVCFFMLMLGYSLNLLTLLAMVLAIGLVVDDAIVVLENIYRHIEEGLSPFDAALIGAREIASPVISMTITLAAVYAPIGFMGGLTGKLFTEFAFTLAGAVIVSGFIALTLSPMMCSRLLSAELMHSPTVQRIDRIFDGLKGRYERWLTASLNYRKVTLVFVAIILSSCYFLAITTQAELAPAEDQSVLWGMLTGPQYANIDYMKAFSDPLNKTYDSLPEKQDYFYVLGMGTVNAGISGLILKPWGERKRSADELRPVVQNKLRQLSGLQAAVFNPPALPGAGGGLPVQFVIKTTNTFENLYKIQKKLEEAAKDSGLFMYVSSSLRFDNPQLTVSIHRDKAGDMGVDMAQIGGELSTLLGESYVNWFSIDGRSYQVIPQVSRAFRYNPADINQYYVSTSSGDMIPLSSIADLNMTVQPNALSTFQQLNSATIQGVITPGRTLTEALDFLRAKAKTLLPTGYSIDYAGESRQTMEEGSSLLYAFFFALIVIYLVLAAKFESWRDPLVILISVPMSIFGGLLPLNISSTATLGQHHLLGALSLNIYTGVGLITLIGLVSKHGILIVEFANNLQREKNLSPLKAVIESAALRLRPVLMTTFSMVFGVVPLLCASGAGAVSRYNIGWVIFSGMMIGTSFTLFVVPMVYSFLAKDHRPTTPAAAADPALLSEQGAS
jgi:multidrug efflux pump